MHSTVTVSAPASSGIASLIARVAARLASQATSTWRPHASNRPAYGTHQHWAADGERHFFGTWMEQRRLGIVGIGLAENDQIDITAVQRGALGWITGGNPPLGRKPRLLVTSSNKDRAASSRSAILPENS